MVQDLRGQVLGRYRLVTELGAGGMGTVYFAEHVGIGRRAAIKVLDPALASNTELVQRFFTEARAVNALRHPNIVDIEDLSTEGDLHFLVMELLEGETLGARLERERRLSGQCVLDILRPIASALTAAHGRGMVHRDLKPENVFLARDASGAIRVKLLDFGIVKLHADGAPNATQAGMLLGTPAYMSPEQCAGQPIDCRSDIYSLGVFAYEALVGRLPFVRTNVLALLAAHQFDTPIPPARAERSVQAAVSDVVMQALQKAPGARMQSATALADGFERAVLGRTALAVSEPSVSIEVQRAQTRKVGGKLSFIVGKRIAAGTLHIPSMPESCMQCMELLAQPRVRMGDLAQRVGRDPLLSTRVLALAGSSALGAREKIVDIETALVRVGIDAFRGIVVEMAARQVFVSRDARLRARLRSIWERSVAVGVAAGGLASAIGSPISRGAAHSAGLVSEIGHPILAAFLLDVERASGARGAETTSWVTDEVFAGVVAENGREVGARVAAEWRLPPELEGPIVHSGTWDDRGGSGSMRDVVRVAGMLATLAGFCAVGEIAVDPVALEEGRKRLPLGPDAEARLIERIPALVLEQIGGGAAKSPSRVTRVTA